MILLTPNENEIDYTDEMATVIYYNVTRYMIENLICRITRSHLKNEIEIASITNQESIYTIEEKQRIIENYEKGYDGTLLTDLFMNVLVTT